MLVYQVNGQELTSATDGSSMQLWMHATVARYFTRNITDIELTREDVEPDVQQVDPCYRNKINIMNYAGGCTFVAGDEITFEGVADDLGSPIEAIEFSFDGGATWTSCATEGATADKWVNWQFSTSFEDAGDYRMTVRAKTADGMVSPLAATLLFQVSSEGLSEGAQSGRALFFGRPLAVWQWFYGSREGRRMIYTCHSIG